jgi:hypothetical protein
LEEEIGVQEAAFRIAALALIAPNPYLWLIFKFAPFVVHPESVE